MAPATGLPGSLSGKVVVIDPGHDGGNGAHATEINRRVDAGGFQKECDTTGAETDSGYTEARFNLAVSAMVAAELRGAGATVDLTRTSDSGWGPCIDERAAIGTGFTPMWRCRSMPMADPSGVAASMSSTPLPVV